MATKLLRILGPDFLPRAKDTDAAQHAIVELGPVVEALRGDVATHDTLTDRARLARHLIQRAELEMLCGGVTQAPQDLVEAAELLSVDERQAPLMLVAARQAWAEILLGYPAAATSVLEQILQVEDVTVRAWEDQLLLWLAAAQLAQDQRTEALRSLKRAKAIYEDQPRRDSRLVTEALLRLGAVD